MTFFLLDHPAESMSSESTINNQQQSTINNNQQQSTTINNQHQQSTSTINMSSESTINNNQQQSTININNQHQQQQSTCSLNQQSTTRQWLHQMTVSWIWVLITLLFTSDEPEPKIVSLESEMIWDNLVFRFPGIGSFLADISNSTVLLYKRNVTLVNVLFERERMIFSRCKTNFLWLIKLMQLFLDHSISPQAAENRNPAQEGNEK